MLIAYLRQQQQEILFVLLGFIFSGYLSSCNTQDRKWPSRFIHLFYVWYLPHNRLVKSESSDSLLSQPSGNTNNYHRAVTSRKQWAERSLSMTCPSVPALCSETSKVTTKASSAPQSVPETKPFRQIKESRSQKHTRVKVPASLLCGKKFLYLSPLKHMSKNCMNEMKWYL